MSSKIPGEWIETGDGKARAQNMLKANPNARAVWVGKKGGSDPKITVFGRDGRQEHINHAPADSFRERVTELVEGWPAGESSTQSAADDTEAAARAILNA